MNSIIAVESFILVHRMDITFLIKYGLMNSWVAGRSFHLDRLFFNGVTE